MGRPQSDRQPVSDFVLKRPGGDDRISIDQAIERAADAVETILGNGDLTNAQNIYNR